MSRQNRQISASRETNEAVESFKYLGATITEDGRSLPEIKTRIAIATRALAK